MRIEEIFKRNPFQNLITASQDAALFQLRGHEEEYDTTIKTIGETVIHNEYSSDLACHTIVFGEWGHGKTHLLVSLEKRINEEFSQQAKAIYFEPNSVNTNDVLLELALNLEADASDVKSLISALKNARFPNHIFLLIDECQALVGEDIHGNYENDLQGYYEFLEELLNQTDIQAKNLHIFFGFSANSARAIEKMGKLPLFHTLSSNVFTLNSLSEEAQWEMILDHLKIAPKNNGNTDLNDLIERGVSTTINRLTGGNPRWVLMLMNEVFNHALKHEKIDAQVCYEALQKTFRIDNPSQKYFDSYIIDDVVETLKNGQVNEVKIAELFTQQKSSILGEWSSVDHEILTQFDLNAAQIKKDCPSIKNYKVFEQNFEGDFVLTEDFLDLIGVYSPRNIIESSEREFLFRLSLEPLTLLRGLIDGMSYVLTINHYPSSRESGVGHKRIDMLYFNVSTTSRTAPIPVGLIVFKGVDVPQEVYQAITARIKNNKCDVVIIIMDTLVKRDNPESSFRKFINSYEGDIDIQKRFFFIENITGNAEGFDENFFVTIYNSDKIPHEESVKIFNRLGIKHRLEKIAEDSIYCPIESERDLLNHIMFIDQGYNVGGLRDIHPDFSFVNQANLMKLSDYIKKRGRLYSARSADEIKPFRQIIKTIKDHESGIDETELNEKFRQKWILTGTENARNSYMNWAIKTLEKKQLIQRKEEILSFKDIEKEINANKKEYAKIESDFSSLLEKYINVSLPTHYYRNLIDKSEDIKERFNKLNGDNDNLYEKVVSCLKDLKDLYNDLKKVAQTTCGDLNKKLDELNSDFLNLKESITWPFNDAEVPNPYLIYLKPLETKIDSLKNLLSSETPQYENFTSLLSEIGVEISIFKEELSKTPPNKVDSSLVDLDTIVFQIFSALRNQNKGQVTITYED